MDKTETDEYNKRYAADEIRLKRALEDKTLKTAGYIQHLYDEWVSLNEKGETSLGFHRFANITWNEYRGWEETGQWPPPKKVNICIVCEKELEPVDYASVAQPYDGGEIRANFSFGSRYDYIGFRSPVVGPPYTEHDLGEPFGVIKSGQLIGTEPREGSMDAPERANRLAACSHILAVICDDCFEKKAHLFKGYEENETAKRKLRPVVE